MRIGLLKDAVYGGRIDTNEDARVLDSFLHHYFSPKVIGGNHNERKSNMLELSCSFQGHVRIAPHVVLPTSTHVDDYKQLVKSEQPAFQQSV